MCSQNEAEIEAVRNALSSAGIVSETRNHPVAEALGVNGIELWVQDERDFFDAANLFARMRKAKRGELAAPEEPEQLPIAEELFQPPRVLVRHSSSPVPAASRSGASANGQAHQETLEEASSLLEKEIEQMLESETELSTECTSLRDKIDELTRDLAGQKAALNREKEARTTAEARQAQEVSELKEALMREQTLGEKAQEQAAAQRTQWERAEQEMSREREEWQQHIASCETALTEARQSSEVQSRLLQNREAEVADLKNALQLERKESEIALSDIRTLLSEEREARIAAEQRAEAAAAAQTSLELQLLEQKDLQQKLQLHLNSLNALCSKLHAKRINRAVPA